MKPTPFLGADDSFGIEAGDDVALPCATAMVAATFALMTAWAAPDPAARPVAGDLRLLLARKIVSNLFFLQQHPQVSPALRQVLAQARARWVALADAAAPSQAPPACARRQLLQ